MPNSFLKINKSFLQSKFPHIIFITIIGYEHMLAKSHHPFRLNMKLHVSIWKALLYMYASKYG